MIRCIVRHGAGIGAKPEGRAREASDAGDEMDQRRAESKAEKKRRDGRRPRETSDREGLRGQRPQPLPLRRAREGKGEREREQGKAAGNWSASVSVLLGTVPNKEDEALPDEDGDCGARYCCKPTTRAVWFSVPPDVTRCTSADFVAWTGGADAILYVRDTPAGDSVPTRQPDQATTNPFSAP